LNKKGEAAGQVSEDSGAAGVDSERQHPAGAPGHAEQDLCAAEED